VNSLQSVAIVTSIPPQIARTDGGNAVGSDYQDLCIRSWLQNDFQVLSVNVRDEVQALEGRFPTVKFIAVQRDARAIGGKKTPFIADMLQALLATNASSFGIVNADLVFEPDGGWHRLSAILPGTVFASQRLDTSSLLVGPLRPYMGFDCFFFDRATALELMRMAAGFAIGLPWWDAWLPAAAAIAGRRFGIIHRPAVLHLSHPQAYDEALHSSLAMTFARFVAMHGRAALPAIAKECTEFVQLASAPRRSQAQQDQVANAYAAAMGKWYESLMRGRVDLRLGGNSTGPQTEMPPKLVAIFGSGFEERLRA
jgi:hypothetical protein